MKATNQSALLGLTMAFFVVGFMSAFNDILMPHFRFLFHLSYLKMTLVSFSFFIAYGVFSIPMSSLTASMGYKNGIIVGFLLNLIGSMIILLAVSLGDYYLFLLALFVAAAGVVLILVSAMPYSLLLGQEKTASSRVTFMEVFHSLGAMIAPLYGGYLLFSVVAASGVPIHGIDSLSLKHMMDVCYFIIIVALVVLVTFIAALPMPKINLSSNLLSNHKALALFKNGPFLACVLALFLYVGCEVSIGGFMVNYAQTLQVPLMDKRIAADFVSVYWGLLLVGRFIGSFILRVMKPRLLVLLCTLCAIVLVASTFLTTGYTALLAMVAVGLFNSIVFPTVYSLGLKYANQNEISASGILALAVTGGAILPLVQGQIADSFNLQQSYLVPIVCYAIIVIYCLLSRRSDH